MERASQTRTTQLLAVVGRDTLMYSSGIAGHSNVPSDEDPGQLLIAVHDAAEGILWTGHADGEIRASVTSSSDMPAMLRPSAGQPPSARGGQANARTAVVDTHTMPDRAGASSEAGGCVVHPDAITAMCLGGRRVVWAGDASGRCCAVGYGEVAHALRPLWPLQQLAAAAPLPMKRPARGVAQGASEAPQPGTPVTAILAKHDTVTAATAACTLHLLRASDATQLGSINFSKYGMCSVMVAVNWRSDVPQSKAPEALGWRLLTGHAGGLCLLWDLSNGRVSAVCAVGPQGPPVVSISVCHALDCMILGLEDGKLAMCALPSASMGMVRIGQGKLPTWTLPQHIIRAHNSRLTAFDARGANVVTGSRAGGIKAWDVAVLKSAAVAQGLSFPRVPRSSMCESLETGSIGSVHALQARTPNEGDGCAPTSPARSASSVNDSFPGFKSGTAVHATAAPPASGTTHLTSLASQAAHSGIHPFEPDSSTSMGGGAETAEASPEAVRVVSEWLESAAGFHNLIRQDELRMIEEIGCGAEGSVFRGRWHHIDVACKEMHPASYSFDRLTSIANDIVEHGHSTVLEAIMQEVQALIDVSQHPNVVRFIGLCIDPPRIVTEYYPLGSMFDLLCKARQGDHYVIRQLSWARRLQMLHNIAAGMAYLHSRSYVHGDLRSPNVFVGLDGHVKIGDFGFARLLGDHESAETNRTSNPRWLAPEVLKEGCSSRAADVFSFAIIMWEMLTWQIPYTGYFSLQVAFNHFRDDFRPDIPPDTELPVSKSVNLEPFKALMNECWHQVPDQRPTFSVVAARLSCLMHWQSTIGRIRAQVDAASAVHKMQAQTGERNADAALRAAHADAATSRAPSMDGGADKPAVLSAGKRSATITATDSPASLSAAATLHGPSNEASSEVTAQAVGNVQKDGAHRQAAVEPPGSRAHSTASTDPASAVPDFVDGAATAPSPGGLTVPLAALLTQAVESAHVRGGPGFLQVPMSPSSAPRALFSANPDESPEMPMPGHPTTQLTSEAAAWLVSVMSRKHASSTSSGGSSGAPAEEEFVRKFKTGRAVDSPVVSACAAAAQVEARPPWAPSNGDQNLWYQDLAQWGQRPGLPRAGSSAPYSYLHGIPLSKESSLGEAEGKAVTPIASGAAPAAMPKEGTPQPSLSTVQYTSTPAMHVQVSDDMEEHVRGHPVKQLQPHLGCEDSLGVEADAETGTPFASMALASVVLGGQGQGSSLSHTANAMLTGASTTTRPGPVASTRPRRNMSLRQSPTRLHADVTPDLAADSISNPPPRATDAEAMTSAQATEFSSCMPTPFANLTLVESLDIDAANAH
uniref:Protein kinase domain-containing protein n=1 Tax=Chlamydomonas euryale TaxID=1486919 RepID=A0A7R9VE76_9CHLO